MKGFTEKPLKFGLFHQNLRDLFNPDETSGMEIGIFYEKSLTFLWIFTQ